MIIPWTAQPSPDGIKPESWRIRLLVKLSPLTGLSHAAFFQVVLDTGALWTTFTEDFGRASGITDIQSGRATSVRWFGVDHDAWQHRIRMTVALDPSAQDTVTLEAVDVLFMKGFSHPVTKRNVSLAVLGMDCLTQLRFTLDGPSAVIRF